MNDELKIDDEFKNLIPAITEEEYLKLLKSIHLEGCRDRLIIWGDILLDGHNRYEICQCLKIKFETVGKLFDNREQAKVWIINNQLARRNLTPEQISQLRGMKQNLEAGGQGGDQKSNCHNDSPHKQSRKHENTAKKLAKEYGVSESTIYRDAKFAKAVDKLPQEEKQEILSGKSKKTKQEIMGIEKKGSESHKAKSKKNPPDILMFASDLSVKDIPKLNGKLENILEVFEQLPEQIKKFESILTASFWDELRKLNHTIEELRRQWEEGWRIS